MWLIFLILAGEVNDPVVYANAPALDISQSIIGLIHWTPTKWTSY